MDMNKYQEALKRLEGMVLTSPYARDIDCYGMFIELLKSTKTGE